MVEQNARFALSIANRGYVLVDGSNRSRTAGRPARDARGEMFLGGGWAEGDRIPEFPPDPRHSAGEHLRLGAIGVTLTFGILRFANFAHGETMTLGAYLTVTLILITGWHPLAVVPAAMVLTTSVALGIDRLFYRPLRQSPAVILLIASFGMMLMVRSVIQFGWGVQLRSCSPG